MPTTLINDYTSPESTGKPVVHEDLVKIMNQMMLGDVMTFTTSVQRTAIFATLARNPRVGSMSVLTSTGAVERWTGSAWVAASIPNAASGGGSLTATESLTTTAAYVDMTAPSTFTISKLYTATALKIDMSFTSLCSASATDLRVAVQINGVDYEIVKFVNNAVSIRDYAVGFAVVASGLAAGSYLVKARWRRAAGAGTISRFITDETLYMSGLEVNG